MMKREWTRVYSGYNPKRLWSGLTREQAFMLELEIYRMLHRYQGFPRVIRSDARDQTLIISHVGISLEKLQFIDLEPLVAEKQVLELVEAMRKEGVMHLDLHTSGKNVTFLNGRLYLVDFDIAILDGNFLTQELKSRWTLYYQPDYYRLAFDTLMDIVRRKLNTHL